MTLKVSVFFSKVLGNPKLKQKVVPEHQPFVIQENNKNVNTNNRLTPYQPSKYATVTESQNGCLRIQFGENKGKTKCYKDVELNLDQLTVMLGIMEDLEFSLKASAQTIMMFTAKQPTDWYAKQKKIEFTISEGLIPHDIEDAKYWQRFCIELTHFMLRRNAERTTLNVTNHKDGYFQTFISVTRKTRTLSIICEGLHLNRKGYAYTVFIMVTVFTLDTMARGGIEKLNALENQRLNLDDLHSHSMRYLISEPLTPYKVMVYVLMRSLNQLHSVENFPLELCNKFNAILYGLIKQDQKPFEFIQKVIGDIDTQVWKGVEEHFGRFVDLIKKAGELSIIVSDMLIIHPLRPNESVPPGMWSVLSPIGIWLEKLSVEWERSSSHRQFVLIQNLRKYTSDQPENKYLKVEITESFSSLRDWVVKQIHLIQVCPSVVMEHRPLLERCEAYRNRYPELHETSLLDALNHYRCRNMQMAAYSILQFFDLTIFRPNVADGPSTLKNRLGKVDNRSLRYGPFLYARMHRMFGYKETASNMIFECVKQGQQCVDNTCLRLAVVELASIETHIVPMEKWLERGKSEEGLKNENYVSLNYLMEIVQNLDNQQKDEDIQRSGSTCIDHSGPDCSVLNKQLMDAVEFVTAITMSIEGLFGAKNIVGLDGIMQSARCYTGEDIGAQSRLIRDASIATMSSFRIQKGLWRSARSLANSLLQSNYSDGIASHHEMEAQAIAAVNVVYSFAAEGSWDLIPSLLDKMMVTFPIENNWKGPLSFLNSAEHVLLCKSIVSFDDAFRQTKYSKCKQHVEELHVLSADEALLRKSLLLCHQGRLLDALSLLEESYVYYSQEKSVPFIFKQRFFMQMAVVLAALGEVDRAHALLDEIKDASRNKALGLDLISAMAARRDAVILGRRGHHDEALAIYQRIKYPICTLGTSLERCLYHIGCASVIAEPTDERLNNLGLARQYSRQAGFPYLEKTVLRHVIKFYDELNDQSKKPVIESLLEQWSALDEKYPGTQDWLLF